jgi:hypothetical protein
MDTIIMRATLATAVTLLLTGSSVVGVSAQESREWVTFGVDFGMFSPRTAFQEPAFGESSFESATALGFSVAAWPHERFGLRAKIVRSETNGTNETSEFAALAVQDPTQWSFTAEVTARQMLEMGATGLSPYVALGVGMRHYTWHAARHDESKFFTWTAAGGADIRPTALGPFGVAVEVRGYRSRFNAFGVNGGNWRPGTPARPVDDDLGTDIGFYGGEVDALWSHDLMFTVGVSYNY